MPFPSSAHQTDPANDYVAVELSPDRLPGGTCRAIRCSEDGALDLTTPKGTVRQSVPLFKGDNPLRARAIDEPTTGSAPGVVVALY